LRFTGDVWRDHACCVVLMHENDLNRRPEWTQKVVNGIVQAQAWIRTHRKETAQILSRDNAQRYTPHTYEALEHVLAPEEKMYAHYASSGAIRHPQWKDERISFQPYPYPSYTETLVKMLQKTVVLGNSEFLKTLDPAFAARDLVDDRFVKKAIADLGGMKVFGQAEAYTRTETITA